MGRPAKKRKYAEAKAARKGELQAERDFRRTKKPEESLRDYFDKLMERIDPFETAAILGMTFAVHGIIKGSPELMEKVKVLQHPEFLLLGGFGVIAAQYLPLPEGALKKAAEQTPDWFIWLESFAVAYIIIRHGGQLLGLLEKGLSVVVPMLLGAA